MFDVTMTMFDDEAYCDHIKAAHKAGLPNAGPMAAEDCLAANIKQNKVFCKQRSDQCPHPSHPPAWKGDRGI